ncbi:ankyrin repeat domain-containing protein [Candidatus Tisiphia endosymbiont of Nemotelus uliginosus]|uniref:ankyrin repeat domain-containing protein n=1 Tax=Candidatus Tisiphia endosymbiont of Nemotelus uliginosus TaxID=3077926 RepID=UPI0035C9204F
MGYYGIIPTLIEMGAELVVKDIHGDTPLHHAVANNHLQGVKQLLDVASPPCPQVSNANTIVFYILNQTNKLGWAAVTLAKRKKEVALKEYLIERGAQEELGTSPDKCGLLSAVQNGDYEQAHYLLDYGGADVNNRMKPTGYTGETPLLAAIYNEDVGLIKLLVKYGAEVNTHGLGGIFPLQIAFVRAILIWSVI